MQNFDFPEAISSPKTEFWHFFSHDSLLDFSKRVFGLNYT